VFPAQLFSPARRADAALVLVDFPARDGGRAMEKIHRIAKITPKSITARKSVPPTAHQMGIPEMGIPASDIRDRPIAAMRRRSDDSAARTLN